MRQKPPTRPPDFEDDLLQLAGWYDPPSRTTTAGAWGTIRGRPFLFSTSLDAWHIKIAKQPQFNPGIVDEETISLDGDFGFERDAERMTLEDVERAMKNIARDLER